MKLLSAALLSTVSAQTAEDYASLSARLQGDLFLPGDAGFAENSKLKNPRLEDDGMRQPAAVVVAQSTADVQEAVKFASEFDELAFSVKSTGHCYNGNCMAKDSLHLDLSSMNDIQIEEGADGEVTARAGPGVVFHELYEACEEFGGVVAVGGMGSSVGLVGFSSGGGHGPLVRRFGLGADQLVSTTVVLADGSVVVADEENHSDLFWAIRGGGGGTWGIQVETQLRLHRAPSVYSLSCFYPMASGVRGDSPVDVGTPVLAAFLGTDLTRALPAEWGVYAMGTKIPFQPEALAGYDFVNMDGSVQFEGVYVGNATLEEATASAAPLMNLMPEHQTSCVVREESSFLQWHTSKAATMDPSGDTLRGYMESAFINVDTLGGGGDGAIVAGEELAGIVVNTTLALGATSFAAWFGVHLGGQIKSKDADDTAVSTAFRQADVVLEATANWIRAGADAAEVGWAKESMQGIHGMEGVSGQYLNEADPDEENFAPMFWDSSQYTRLQAVKAEVDPENVFACWQCVEPAK